MAKYFDNQGFRVFAGCLTAKGEGAKSLESACSDRFKILQLDVTSDEEVEEAVKVVKEDLDGEGKVFYLMLASYLNVKRFPSRCAVSCIVSV